MSVKTSLIAVAQSAVLRAWYGRAPRQDGQFGRGVLWNEEGSTVARETLASGRPCLIARFGSTELACVNYFTRWRAGRIFPVPYPRQVCESIQRCSGVFPTDDESLDRFCETYLNAVSKADVMGVWFNRNEDRIVERYCPQAQLVFLEALNTVIRQDPWSAELAGKVVLVVHPFVNTIESQYRTRRALLFENPSTLPEFELKTLPAVQSLAGNDGGYRTWFDALEDMRERMAAIDFDVAVIGAGAYGLPLAAAAKDLGCQAVQLGGATQLLFGIRGRRWEDESPDEVAPLFNEYWVRPSAEETPRGSDSVEGGCYW
jgi:hypothetical protein